ncbi:TMEM175 family protein [Streptomyces sp. NPDC051639]|uniref:TMEM175 family protein n=1 Tax=unclassified Streptomyces TaxID=2593676 RepID=UPI00341A6849
MVSVKGEQAQKGEETLVTRRRYGGVPHSDTGRAEAFSDGVLAIVITLLVLHLKPPPIDAGRLLAQLLSQWPTYLAYVASYLYIAVVWLNHKAAFQRIKVMTRGLHWANLGVLFSTALLPWPTALVSEAIAEGNPPDDRVAVGLYAIIGAMLWVSWMIFFHVLFRHPELLEDSVDETFFHGERLRAVVGALLYAAAGLVGVLTIPALALAIFVLLPLFYGITSHGYAQLKVLGRRRLPPKR